MLKKAKKLEKIIEGYFKNKVSSLTPCIDDRIPFEWYSVTFVAYRTFHLMYEVERGRGNVFLWKGAGLCINFSEENRNAFEHKHEKVSEEFVVKNLQILDEELRLRLPDKFLAQFD